jgi:membrane protein implicated in regulation of membrane protease activity
MESLFQFSDTLRFWHWWIFAIVLLGLEIIVPGTFFLWMGAAAGVVGLVLLIIPDFSWQGQVLVFAVLSVVAVIGWQVWLRRHPIETKDPTLNAGGTQYIGRVLTLDGPLVDGVGKAKAGDSLWRVSAAGDLDLPDGGRVRVTGVDGATLVVEKASTQTTA